MDNRGTSDMNTNQNASPFAPVDIPDVNNIPTQGAMPPMPPTNTSAMPGAGMGQTMQLPPMPVGQTAGSNGAGQAQAPMGQGVQAGQTMQTTQVSQGVSGAVQGGQMKAGDEAVKNSAKPEVRAGGTEIKMSDIPEPKLQAEKSEKVEEKKPEKVEPKKEEVKKVISSEVPVATAAIAAAANAEDSTMRGITIEPLLEECIRQNASDLHLQVGLPPILRIDGALRPMTTYPALDDMTIQRLVFSTLDANQKMILKKDKEFDYSFAFGDLGRFRVNAFQEKGNMAAAFRLIPNMIRSIADLGIPGVVEEFAERPNGLVLVTGPTGSGKSTTLAALVDKVNTERAMHIITIEDPIEFTHRSKRSVVAQREVHYDTYSFAAALRSILREDPDVVLIGEMRDLETIQAAITVAETGHLVFATLHTNSAAQSIDRMIDVFPAHQQPQVRTQLANILVGICSQRLVPAIDGGRIAVTEVLITNPAVQAIIREGKTHQLDMVIQTGMSQGMQTMDRELAKYVRAGIIAYDTAREYAVDPTEFDRLARG